MTWQKSKSYCKNGEDDQIQLYCDLCRKKINPGPYTKKDGKNYHIECFRQHLLPRCCLCGKIIEGEYIGHKGKDYHKLCFETGAALKCALCGKIINGKYLKDYWGNIYHPEHRKQFPSCHYCSRLMDKNISGTGKILADGRRICGLCLPAVVHSGDQASTLLVNIKDRLSRLGIEIKYKHSLTLVDSKELALLSGKKKINPQYQGYTRREATFINNKITSFKIEMFILNHLPHMHFISTGAHEAMHVWQYLHVKKELPEDINEGSCNYASYLVLKQFSDANAKYIIDTMLKSENRIYGKGFQKIFDLVRTHGIPWWLRFLQE